MTNEQGACTNTYNAINAPLKHAYCWSKYADRPHAILQTPEHSHISQTQFTVGLAIG